MPGFGAECVVPNFPVHTIFLTQEGVDAQFFKRKYAAEVQEIFQTRSKEYIKIEVEPPQVVDRQVPEEVVPLYWFRKRIEHIPVLRKPCADEFLDLLIVEKQVFKFWVQKSQICDRGSRKERQVEI